MYPIGISLSGGAARGIAHIGVLQALIENNLAPKIISGSSAGAIVGLFYAAGYSPTEILKVVKESSILKIFGFGIGTSGLSDLTYLKKLIIDKIPHNQFSELKIPFFVAASNLTDGCCEYLNEGNLADVVVASCSIPMVFKPAKINNKIYIDGGFFDNLPVKPIRELCQNLIAVNVNPHKFDKDPSNVFSIGQRCFDITVWRNSANQINSADIFIDVEEAAKFRLIDVGRADDLYNEGYLKAIKQLPEIIEKVRRKNAAALVDS